MRWVTFARWEHPAVRHGFSLRPFKPKVEPAEALDSSLSALDWSDNRPIEAEQPHGGEVALIRALPEGSLPLVPIPGVDALVTQLPQVPLAIRVADCGPVYFHDPVTKVIALAHSGKKGTALNILSATLKSMQQAYGSQAGDVRVFLGPCIRPPHYEVDFAAEIGVQARSSGVLDYIDSEECTASNLDRYYSYRAEKGKTGRLWAVLMLR
jgi:polyphenol oxidase